MAPAPRPIELAALEPAGVPRAEPAPPVGRGPFGLAGADSGTMSARWREIQPAIELEAQLLARCRTNPAICPAAAASFNAVIEEARARSGRARLGAVNRAVNLAIRWTSDLAQYGVADVWASPLMTFASGAGDCEDYAIAKYVALVQAGLPAADLRLVLVHDRRENRDHMVAAARLDGDWLILDNRTMRLVADRDVPDLTPLTALGGEPASHAIAAAQRAAAPAAAWNTAGLAVVL